MTKDEWITRALLAEKCVDILYNVVECIPTYFEEVDVVTHLLDGCSCPASPSVGDPCVFSEQLKTITKQLKKERKRVKE